MHSEQLSTYLNKIGFQSELNTDVATMLELHKLQHQTIPFENLSIVNGHLIETANEAIFEKLVLNHRGGYCFELNGLMHQVLSTVGYNVTRLLGRVHLSGKPSGRGHMVNLVTIDGKKWIVDAGFGSSTPRSPLPLVFDQELTTDKQTFRFVKHEDFGVMLQGKSDEGWADLYSLDMAYVCEGDIEYGNHFASTGTGSIFTNNIVAVVRTDYGSNILFNNRLKVDSANSATEIELKSSEDFSQALQEHFGIHYSISPAQLESYLAKVAV